MVGAGGKGSSQFFHRHRLVAPPRGFRSAGRLHHQAGGTVGDVVHHRRALPAVPLVLGRQLPVRHARDRLGCCTHVRAFRALRGLAGPHDGEPEGPLLAFRCHAGGARGVGRRTGEEALARMDHQGVLRRFHDRHPSARLRRRGGSRRLHHPQRSGAPGRVAVRIAVRDRRADRHRGIPAHAASARCAHPQRQPVPGGMGGGAAVLPALRLRLHGRWRRDPVRIQYRRLGLLAG